MNKHSIVNLKCPCFLFRYTNLDIPSQALFNLHRASALPLRCGSEDGQNFQSPPGHSRQPVRRRRYCKVSVWHGVCTILYRKLQNVNKVFLDSRLGPTLSCCAAEIS